jgi:3-oxoacyl-[acyl-carrier-protein] synthase II
VLTNGQTGIAYGSSTGSTGPVSEFATMLTEKHTNNITGTTYVQMMPHTTAVNTGLFFGLRGRVIPTSSACTSGSQAIGYAWEAIRHGYQTVMVAGALKSCARLKRRCLTRCSPPASVTMNPKPPLRHLIRSAMVW